MTISNAILLGLLQALGEFLPISSSAHLALFPFFCGEAYQGLAFDVALHLATLFAVVLYFRADLFCLCKAGFSAPKSADGRLFWLIGLATLPAAVAGYIFEDAAENIFRNPMLIAAALMIFALFLYWADRKADKTSARALTWRVMLIIGFAQALAIMPGVSRSGVTITAALFLGLGRVEGARISFLLSIPVIFGAAVLQLKDISAQQLNAPLFAGFAAALIGGWLVIKFLMKYLRSHNFNIFVYYRLALGALIIALYSLKA